jgi:hypothetical protein
MKKPEQIAQGLEILKLDILDAELNRVSVEYFSIRKKSIHDLLMRARNLGEISKGEELEAIVNCLEVCWQGTILQWALLKNGKLQVHLRKNLETILKTRRNAL